MRLPGFTLMEVLVVIGLFALVMVFVVGIFIGHNDLYYAQRAEINAVGSARHALDDITDEIREAVAVQDSILYQGTTYQTDGDTLVVRLPALDSSGVPIASTYDYIIYYLDPGSPAKLRKTTAPNASSFRRAEDQKLLTEFLNSIAFAYNDPTPANASRININLTTQDSSRLNTRRITLTEEVYLRNH